MSAGDVDVEHAIALMHEVVDGRVKAHLKHGDNSVEALGAGSRQWLPILMEEVGEAAHELTYDASPNPNGIEGPRAVDVYPKLRAELIDVLTVASAWVAAIDREMIR